VETAKITDTYTESTHQSYEPGALERRQRLNSRGFGRVPASLNWLYGLMNRLDRMTSSCLICRAEDMTTGILHHDARKNWTNRVLGGSFAGGADTSHTGLCGRQIVKARCISLETRLWFVSSKVFGRVGLDFAVRRSSQPSP
jgi:hypothetical protein